MDSTATRAGAHDLTLGPHAHSSRCWWDYRRPGWVCESRSQAQPSTVRLPEQRSEPADDLAPALTPG